LIDVHFDAGRVPDYSGKHVQQLYLLRYAYAYAFEYKSIYRKLWSRMQHNNSIKVTSIGCGALIDYWSLAHVVNDDCEITYCGIDAVDWSYKFPRRKKDNVTYAIGNAIELLGRSPCFSSDVYVFPKSISEFSVLDVQKLSTYFSADSLTKDTVHFVITLRADADNKADDMKKASILYQRMIDCGFHSEDENNVCYRFSDENRGKKIQQVDNDFSHPWAVVNYLNDLYGKCSNRSTCGKSNSCEKRLGRMPILNCQYTIGQIFTFYRGKAL